MSNRLDPDEDQLYVGPDLGPNCLQRLSADDKSCCLMEFLSKRKNYKAYLVFNMFLYKSIEIRTVGL